MVATAWSVTASVVNYLCFISECHVGIYASPDNWRTSVNISLKLQWLQAVFFQCCNYHRVLVPPEKSIESHQFFPWNFKAHETPGKHIGAWKTLKLHTSVCWYGVSYYDMLDCCLCEIQETVYFRPLVDAFMCLYVFGNLSFIKTMHFAQICICFCLFIN